MKRRVVVTGMFGISPIGIGWDAVRKSLFEGHSGIVRMDEWEQFEGLETRLGAPVRDFQSVADYPRKKTRSMGRDSLMATRSADLAFADAGLEGAPLISDGRTGVAFGCTQGSPRGVEVYATKFYGQRTTRGIRGSDYIQFMSHTCAANIAQFFGIVGRVLPTCSACTSGSQGIGTAYETIGFGQQDVMVSGGAEELDGIDAAIFDVLYAASTRNDDPTTTPRPFDSDRDGVVVAEGAASLILEDRDAALARGARVYAEVLGYATCCDGRHMTNPDPRGMERVMRLALADASLEPADIDYVNAHGTATQAGDVAESAATYAVFGDRVPVSTFKGHMGHTLGACGALEAWMAIRMLREGWVAPTLNLETVDTACAPLDYVRDHPRKLGAEIFMSNNFAFGGISTSLIFRLESSA